MFPLLIYGYDMHSFYKIFAFLFLSTLIACSTTSVDDRYTDKDKTTPDEDITNTITIVTEDFNMLPYKNEMDLPELPKKANTTSDIGISERITNTELWYTYSDEDTLQMGKIHSKETGYRIQVFTGEELKEAEAIQSELFFKTKQKAIYIDFEPPVFKVKFGDFIDVNSAKDMDFRLKQLGFKNTVIVSDSVNVFR